MVIEQIHTEDYLRDKSVRCLFDCVCNGMCGRHVLSIDIYLSGLLARRQNAWSQDGGNMRVIANGVNR